MFIKALAEPCKTELYLVRFTTSTLQSDHVQLPSTEELEALFADRKLNSIVFFLDETFEELAFDVTTTVLEAVEQLAGIIKLQVGNRLREKIESCLHKSISISAV